MCRTKSAWRASTGSTGPRSANRSTATSHQPVPQPTALNSPQVAIDLTGQGLLAWQEPDDTFINRIYARRIFGMVPGNLLDVSPTTFNGHPLNGAADELVARRWPASARARSPGARSPRPARASRHARVFEAEIPSSFSPKGAAFGAAKAVDGPAGSEGPAKRWGRSAWPSTARATSTSATASAIESFDGNGTESSVGAPIRLDSGSEVPGDPVLTRAEDGALAAAWKVQIAWLGRGRRARAPRRRHPQPRARRSAPRRRRHAARRWWLASRRRDLRLSCRATDANTQIAAVVVRAPPGEFVTDVPNGWFTSPRVPSQWEVPLAGAGTITYSILVDDRGSRRRHHRRRIRAHPCTGRRMVSTRSRCRRPTRSGRSSTACPPR